LTAFEHREKEDRSLFAAQYSQLSLNVFVI